MNNVDDYIANLRISPDAEAMRQFLIRTPGHDWRRCLDFRNAVG